MSTPVSLPLNAYFTRDPAQVAQEKYSNATWNNAYGYITLIAFAALAAIANVFLLALLHPSTLLLIDVGIAALGYKQVQPKAEEWFARAEKLKCQGDKETQIQALLTELRATPANLREEFSKRYISIDHLSAEDLQKGAAVLARAIWHEKRACNLLTEMHRYKGEHKFREAAAAVTTINKCLLKGSFFASLIGHPNRSGKFKDTFAWINRSEEDRALANQCKSASANHIVQTREPIPRIFSGQDLVGYDPSNASLRALISRDHCQYQSEQLNKIDGQLRSQNHE